MAAMTTTLGADIRAIRKSKGLTLTDLSDRTGKSVGWLSQVERDISSPGVPDLERLADVLGVPISLFFGSAEAVERERGRSANVRPG
jgi:transcriptional regulator with XRE-family HTH domain